MAPQSKVQSVVAAQEVCHKQVSDDVREYRDEQQRAAKRVTLPEFAVLYYSLYSIHDIRVHLVVHIWVKHRPSLVKTGSRA